MAHSMAISNVNRAGNPNICKSRVLFIKCTFFCGSPSNYYLEYYKIHEIYFTEIPIWKCCFSEFLLHTNFYFIVVYRTIGEKLNFTKF